MTTRMAARLHRPQDQGSMALVENPLSFDVPKRCTIHRNERATNKRGEIFWGSIRKRHKVLSVVVIVPLLVKLELAVVVYTYIDCYYYSSFF